MAERHATAVNCIDGRTQNRVLSRVAAEFGVRHVDLVTAPGAVAHLVGEISPVGRGMIDSVSVSIRVNHSTQVAVVAHQDCRGNPVPDQIQLDQLGEAGETLRAHFPSLEVVALFLDFDRGFRRVE